MTACRLVHLECRCVNGFLAGPGAWRCAAEPGASLTERSSRELAADMPAGRRRCQPGERCRHDDGSPRLPAEPRHGRGPHRRRSDGADGLGLSLQMRSSRETAESGVAALRDGGTPAVLTPLARFAGSSEKTWRAGAWLTSRVVVGETGNGPAGASARRGARLALSSNGCCESAPARPPRRPEIPCPAAERWESRCASKCSVEPWRSC